MQTLCCHFCTKRTQKNHNVGIALDDLPEINFDMVRSFSVCYSEQHTSMPAEPREKVFQWRQLFSTPTPVLLTR